MVRTDIKEEVAALLVRYHAIGIFGVLSDIELDDEMLIFRSVCIFFQGVGQVLVTYDIREASVCRSMQILLKKTFHICCPSFVQPKVSGFCMATSDCMALDYKQESAATIRT